MQDRERHLRHNVLGGDQIYVVYVANILQSDIPFAQLFRSETETVLLVCDVVILTEDAAEITATQEDAARPIVPLDAWFFSKVGSDSIHDHIASDQARPALLETIHTTKPRA